MRFLRVLREPLRELAAMIGLQHLEWERSMTLRFFEKAERSACCDPVRHLRMSPSTVHIKKRVDVESLPCERVDMDGVDLYQIASVSHVRPLDRRMIFLPFALFFE